LTEKVDWKKRDCQAARGHNTQCLQAQRQPAFLYALLVLKKAVSPLPSLRLPLADCSSAFAGGSRFLPAKKILRNP